ncbi:MAG: PIN domain-containing protein [Burkholderiales bacterium]|nr:PIN domain-containing protein [Phycisphaerae bacterium]
MIAVDTNILIYAHRGESDFNVEAIQIIANLANASTQWIVPLHCLVEFFAIVTHPKVYRPPSSIDDALEFLDDVIASPSVIIGGDAATTWSRLRLLLVDGAISGPQAYDARIAAVCLDHGVTELWSVDRGFSRFPHLKVVNPLAKS